MTMTTAQKLKKVTKIAKSGARTNIEKKNVNRLVPIAIMALRDSDDIKIARIKMRESLDINDALKSCIKHYDAYAYTFVKEGEGTEFPNALLAAEGDFRLMPADDKYQVVTLQTSIDGMPTLFVSRARIIHTTAGRTLSDWADVRLEEDSILYTRDCETNESGI